jgi:transcriptional regulator with XRE-family HTH domain
LIGTLCECGLGYLAYSIYAFGISLAFGCNKAKAMSVGERMKKVREIKGLNQKEVAARMKVAPPTYAIMEEDPNPKYSTLKKFCEAAEINISFLVAEDLPLTDDNAQFFDSMKDRSFLLTYEQLRQRVDVYGEILNLSEEDFSDQILKNSRNQPRHSDPTA